MTNQQILNTLGDLRTAIENENYEIAREISSDLSDLYDEVESDEQSFKQKISAFRGSDELSPEERHELELYLQSATAAEFQRNGLLAASIGMFLSDDPEDLEETQELVASTEQLEMQEQNLLDAQGTAEETIGDKEAPPAAVIASVSDVETIETATTTSLTVTVSNAGDLSAETVELTARADDGLTVSPSTVTIDTLAGEANTGVEFEITGTSYGVQRLTFELSSENAGTDIQDVTVSVRVPAVTGTSPPLDLDGDGLFEDVDGDGEFTIFDVQAFFTNFQGETVQSNPAAFNFTEEENPEEVTIFDVQALFQKLS
jgi:uncharacterized repeat protein (TIGR01451 family)